MSSSTALLFLVLVSLLPSAVVCLTCYMCVYSSISPLECQQVSMMCAAGERCLYSTTAAIKGSKHVMLTVKGCAVVSQCGVSRQERVAGFNFTHTSHCCDADLCNAAALPGAPCWIRPALSLGVTVLAVQLTST